MYNLIYCVCDTETGGLNAVANPEKKIIANPLVEIAITPFDNDLNNLSEYTSLIKPYNSALEYTDGALKANGLSMETIRQGVDSKQVIEEVCAFVSKLKRGRELPVFCAHNAKFDISFLVEFFKFHKKIFWDYFNPDYIIDTMYWGRSAMPESVNYKLGTVVSNAGLEMEAQHRALADTRATRDLVKYFITNMRNASTRVKSERYRDKFEF